MPFHMEKTLDFFMFLSINALFLHFQRAYVAMFTLMKQYTFIESVTNSITHWWITF